VEKVINKVGKNGEKWYKVGIFVLFLLFTNRGLFMITFIGDYTCRLDDKGRVSLPMAFIRQMGHGIQERFVIKRDIFEKCRKTGINTCIETSGYVPESALKTVLPFTDFLLYDLKLMNAEKHLEHTGKSNDLVNTNARKAAESGVKILFRMPLIPGINDDIQNLKDTADFLGGFNDSARRLEIIPYHRLGKGKYESIGRTYRLASLLPPTPKELASVKIILGDAGITCTISE